MAVDVIMPQMGESIFEGTITKWLKKPGERIERDEPLLEISTDKVDAEIPAPAAGVLREIKVQEGQTVPVQTVVAVIDAEGAPAAAPATPATSAKPAAPAKEDAPAAPQKGAGPAPAGAPDKSAAPSAQAAPAAPAAAGAAQTSAAPPPSKVGAAPRAPEKESAVPEAGGRRLRSSPLARRLAREGKVDLGSIQGTGAGGRVSKQDVLAAMSHQGAGGPATGAAAGAAAASGPPASEHGTQAIPRERIYFGQYQVQPLSLMRQRIAEHMSLSKRVAPHVYSIEEADLTHIVQLREAAKAEFEQRHRTKLTYMPFFVLACVGALREFPWVNASIDGTNLVLHGEINVGIAVALEEGLIVPVVTHAEEKNFLGLQVAINDLAERARTKKLKPEEVQHSTFTITNPGIFGGLMGLPIINQPNAAILGIGAIQRRPGVVDDAIAIRSMTYLTMSYDHRIVDGALAHRFLSDVKRKLETWSEQIL